MNKILLISIVAVIMMTSVQMTDAQTDPSIAPTNLTATFDSTDSSSTSYKFNLTWTIPSIDGSDTAEYFLEWFSNGTWNKYGMIVLDETQEPTNILTATVAIIEPPSDQTEFNFRVYLKTTSNGATSGFSDIATVTIPPENVPSPPPSPTQPLPDSPTSNTELTEFIPRLSENVIYNVNDNSLDWTVSTEPPIPAFLNSAVVRGLLLQGDTIIGTDTDAFDSSNTLVFSIPLSSDFDFEIDSLVYRIEFEIAGSDPGSGTSWYATSPLTNHLSDYQKAKDRFTPKAFSFNNEDIKIPKSVFLPGDRNDNTFTFTVPDNYDAVTENIIRTCQLGTSSETIDITVSSLIITTTYRVNIQYSNPNSELLACGVPEAPAELVLEPSGKGEVSLSWFITSEDGITGYTIGYKRASDSVWIPATTNEPLESRNNELVYSVSDLINSELYDFRVAAVNNIGHGYYSQVSGTPLPAPESLGSDLGSNMVELFWDWDRSNPEAIDYIIKFGKTKDSLETFEDGIRPHADAIVSGLDPLTTYYFSVAAVDSAGPGPESTISITTLPPQVIADLIYSDDGTIKIRFSPRIDTSASSVDAADFTISDGTTTIPITGTSLSQWSLVLELGTPIIRDTIGTFTVSYDPQDNRQIALGTTILENFEERAIIDRIADYADITGHNPQENIPTTVHADYVYSDDGTINIRFSPRIDVDASSASESDFEVSGTTVTNVLLTQYKVTLTLADPLTISNIQSVTVSYSGDGIVAGTATLPPFTNEPVVDHLARTVTVTTDAIYSDDGTIKIRFSPRIDVDASSASESDFEVSGTTVTNVLLTQYKATLTLADPLTSSNIESVTVSYSGDGIVAGTATLSPFTNEPVVDRLARTVDTVRADYVYSDDGTIKIRFSPRIDVNASSASESDFEVSGTTVTNVLLTQYKATLTLADPLTSSNIESVTVSYSGDGIVAGTVTLPPFTNEPVKNHLSHTVDTIRADHVYSDDGKIKIRFSPRIDTSISSAAIADFKVWDSTMSPPTEIPITSVSLTKYKVVLTLQTPFTTPFTDVVVLQDGSTAEYVITADKIQVVVSYDPKEERKISVGSAILDDFTKPVEIILRENP